MNTEPLDIYDGAENCLKSTENQQRDVMASSPEAPAQAREDSARHDSKEEETDDMIPVSDVVAADRPRCKKMPEQANREK
jgi:hypothetical protein